MGNYTRENSKICLGFIIGVWILVGASHAGAVTRIMPLGDSITRGVGPGEVDCELGYRRPLYFKLADAGYTIDFVGSELHPKSFCDDLHGVPVDFDRDHEGHPGRKAEYIRDNIFNQGGDWLGINTADIILLHIGTNDLNSGQAPGDIVTEVSQILERIDQYEITNGRGVEVILAMIINRVPLSSTYSQYNTELAAMAQTRIANGDKLTIIDMENGAGIDYATEMNDAYHPDQNGYAKMADVWYAAIAPMLTSCTDGDGDGYSIEGGECGEIDCDDTIALIHPNATEICNGKDDDCDGITDENVVPVFYRDADGDEYGDKNSTSAGCSAPSGYVSDSTDCDDSNASINPGTTEVCNDVDDNCDGSVDEGVKNTFFRDADGDSYGDPNDSTQACISPDGYVADNTDCDDSDGSINPAAAEICADLKDNNCDSLTDCLDENCSVDFSCTECTDDDGDGYSVEGGICGPADCDDLDASVSPAAIEICGDIIDNDCNSLADCNDANCSDDLICAADVDGDGMADFEEKGPFGTDDSYDADGDGIADHEQDSVVSCHTHDGSHYITMICPLGLKSVRAIPVPPDPPDGISFPYGFFEFTITNLPEGGAARVVFFLGDHMDTFYKYGPTIEGTSEPEWYEFTYDSQLKTGAQFGESTINLNYVDGLIGDDDLSVNGVIVDQGGPGISDIPPPSSNSSGGGGCKIIGANISMSDDLPVYLLLIIACLWMRNRRKK